MEPAPEYSSWHEQKKMLSNAKTITLKIFMHYEITHSTNTNYMLYNIYTFLHVIRIPTQV